MGAPKFDVTTEKGLAAFNGYMGSRSYVDGWTMSSVDTDVYSKITSVPDRMKLPHAFRWYVHIAALQGIRGLHQTTTPVLTYEGRDPRQVVENMIKFGMLDENEMTPEKKEKLVARLIESANEARLLESKMQSGEKVYKRSERLTNLIAADEKKEKGQDPRQKVEEVFNYFIKFDMIDENEVTPEKKEKVLAKMIEMEKEGGLKGMLGEKIKSLKHVEPGEKEEKGQDPRQKVEAMFNYMVKIGQIDENEVTPEKKEKALAKWVEMEKEGGLKGIIGEKIKTLKHVEPGEKEKGGDDEDDFDVFGDDDDGGEEEPKESRAEMLARLKREAEERTARKEAKQRTLVAIEVKPWDVEQDLMALWKKITTTINQDGLKWGESCTLADVAFGIQKIQTTFVMGVNNSSDDIIDAIQAMEDEVQSAEVTSMNVL